MRRFIPIIILAIAAVALGQSRLFVDPNTSQPVEAPHSPSAIDAKAKHDLAVKIAHAAYQKAVVVADQQYIDALAAAEDVALKDGIGAKPEADRIDAARMGEIDQLAQDKKNPQDESANQSTSPVGTIWQWNGYPATETFKADGTAIVEHDSSGNRIDHWQALDDRTVSVNEAGGAVTVWTFSADMKNAMLVTGSKNMAVITHRVK